MPEKKPTGQEPQVEKTPEQLDADHEIEQQRLDRALAMTMFRGGTPEDQSRVSMLRNRLSNLSEVPVSGSLNESTLLDPLTEFQVVQDSAHGALYRAGKISLKDGSKLLVLDIWGEESRSRSRVSSDFMMAMGEPGVHVMRVDFPSPDDKDGSWMSFNRISWKLDVSSSSKAA